MIGALCPCGHPMEKHLLAFYGGDTKERGPCSLCPCRLYRQVPK